MFPSRRITMGGDVIRDDRSLTFGGTDEYLDCGNDSSLQGESDKTYALWVKTEDSGVYLMAKRTGGTGALSLFINGSSKLTAYIGGGAGGSTMSSSVVNDGLWHHIAIVYDNSANSVFFYLDGVADGSDTSFTGTWNDTKKLHIGVRGAGDASHHLVGNISDAVAYEGALSANEIKTIYNGREPFNHMDWSQSGNLRGWWRMGDGIEHGSGLTIYDMSANSNNGSMENMENPGDYSGDTP